MLYFRGTGFYYLHIDSCLHSLKLISDWKSYLASSFSSANFHYQLDYRVHYNCTSLIRWEMVNENGQVHCCFYDRLVQHLCACM